MLAPKRFPVCGSYTQTWNPHYPPSSPIEQGLCLLGPP